jgi:hypothetical protein
MSAAEWPRPAEPMPPEVRRSPRKRGGTRRARPAAIEPPVPAPAPPADFISSDPVALDAEKWPVHPAIWWQPELPLQLPASSGLRSERRFKIPVADFRSAAPPLMYPPAAKVSGAEPLVRVWSDPMPASDLAPLGWDPRTCLPQRGDNGRSGREGSDV